jgi:hypothetical protein
MVQLVVMKISAAFLKRMERIKLIPDCPDMDLLG